MIHLGFSTIGTPDYNIDQVIALAKDNGFEGVEFRFLMGTTDLPSLPPFSKYGLIETRQKFDDAGIKVVCIGTSVRMCSLDPAVRAAQIEDAKVHTEISVALGAKYIRVFGGPLPPKQDVDETLDAIAQGLGQVADMTAASGVTSLLETHDAFCKSPDILDLFERGASDNLEILWDTLHSYRNGEGAETTWKNIGDRIRLVHLKDSNVATSTGFDFALTGEGTIPIMSFVNVLKRENFDGFVNFEWEKGWHPEIPEPDIAIPHFARFMAGNL